MPTPPNSISLLPTPPSSSDPGNFDSRADTFLSALPTFQSQTNSLGTNVYNNAVEANTSATNAANSATSANSSAGDAANSASAASGSASNASTSATNAANSATSANSAKVASENARDSALAAGAALLTASSVTSLTVSPGTKNLTVQTNKSFLPSQYITIVRSSDSSVFMQGLVTSYDKDTGALVVSVDYSQGGSGPFSDWVIGVVGKRGSSGDRPVIVISADTVAVAGNDYVFSAVCKLTMPPNPQQGDTIGISNGSNTTGCTIDFGSVRVKTKLVGVVTMLNVNDNAVVKATGNTSIGWAQL